MDAEQGVPIDCTVVEGMVDLLRHSDDIVVQLKRIAVLIEYRLVAPTHLNRMRPHVAVLDTQVETVWFLGIIVAFLVECHLLARIGHDDRVTVVLWITVNRKYASWVDILRETHVHLNLPLPHEVEHAELLCELLGPWAESSILLGARVCHVSAVGERARFVI